MKIVQLEYFVKTVECGSITRASRELYVTQPALTKAISALESEFSTRLIERTPRGIQVTAAGQEFYTYAKSVLAAGENLRRAFARHPDRPSDYLAISCLQYDFIYEAVDHVRESFPGGLTVNLVEQDRGCVVESVLNRTADLGIVTLSTMDSADFHTMLQQKPLLVETLDDSPVYISMFENAPLYSCPVITDRAASAQRHVSLDIDQPSRRGLHTQNITFMIDSRNLTFCNTLDAALHFMHRFGDMLYTPKWLIKRLQDAGARVVPLMQENGMPYPSVNMLALIRREGESLTAAEEELAAYLRSRFSPNE